MPQRTGVQKPTLAHSQVSQDVLAEHRVTFGRCSYIAEGLPAGTVRTRIVSGWGRVAASVVAAVVWVVVRLEPDRAVLVSLVA
jgi:hypothetical protein